MRDPRYDILFEPVKIGPVTAPNRFYQVPHCNGMGWKHPQALAKMRETKAEGGWGVVCTEEVEIHPTSEFAPYIEGRLWDDADIPAMALMVEGVHRHGALAGCELAYNGFANPNLYSREVPVSPSGGPVKDQSPIHTRALDLEDIRNIRRWHKAAVRRAKTAGFDIIYCYAGHNLSIAMHFLSREMNTRTDEYGGSLVNRARFLRELLEDAHDAAGDTCAIACRIAVDQLLGQRGLTFDGEGREVIELLAELPDLWDVNLADWSNDSVTARFADEGAQERYTAFVKSVTSKPVVGVGRFTSPDAMVSQVKRGVLDLIGAARPSIADPFLPAKVRDGHHDDIRECIGCNICVSGDMTVTPIRCTQNPTMGEEWRRGWHPERIAPVAAPETVLVVGSGPSGLECARALAKRGMNVTIAEKEREAGGRVRLEAKLPGLSTYKRVADYRLQQLRQMANVDFYFDSEMTAEAIAELGMDHIVLATGSRWRLDGLGRKSRVAIPGVAGARVHSPDAILRGDLPSGEVLIYDDDHYYMGGVLAELLTKAGCKVTLATPSSMVSQWTENTLEQGRIQSRLVELGVDIRCNRYLYQADGDAFELREVYGGPTQFVRGATLVPVTSRVPEDGLYQDLKALGITTRRIGDCLAPGTVAVAVYSGHRMAQYWGEPEEAPYQFKREGVGLV